MYHIFGDTSHHVLFGLTDVKFLQNLKELKVNVIHIGKRVDDLFILFASTSYVNKISRNDNAQLWHARLGHLNMDKLKFIVQKNLVDGLLNLTSLVVVKYVKTANMVKVTGYHFKNQNPGVKFHWSWFIVI